MSSRSSTLQASELTGIRNLKTVPSGAFCELKNYDALFVRMLRLSRYLVNLSPLCGLAIIATAPRYQAPVLRAFLQRYLVKRVFFGVSMVCPMISLKPASYCSCVSCAKNFSPLALRLSFIYPITPYEATLPRYKIREN